jgi:hypothetical protein
MMFGSEPIDPFGAYEGRYVREIGVLCGSPRVTHVEVNVGGGLHDVVAGPTPDV